MHLRHEPFTLQDALRMGLQVPHLGRLVKQRRLRRVLKGVYVDAREPDSLDLRALAAGLVRTPETVVCRRSAAWLLGLDVLPPGQSPDQWPLELCVERGSTPPRLPGCRGFSARLPDSDVMMIGDLPVTCPTRTASDCGRYLPRIEAVAAVDAFLHEGLAVLDDLRAAAAELSGQRGARRLRAVLDVADAGAESPGESWTRVLLVDAGLPRPRTQVVVRDQQRAFLARLDMGYPQFLIGNEYDGEAFHSEPAQVAHDVVRRRRAEACGWEVIVARRGDVLTGGQKLVAVTAERLLARGWRTAPDVVERIARDAAHSASRSA